MMTLIAATLAAAAPATPAQPTDAHAQHQQMMGHEHGEMAGMKDCCCKDMDKMSEGHAEHGGKVQQ